MACNQYGTCRAIQFMTSPKIVGNGRHTTAKVRVNQLPNIVQGKTPGYCSD